MIRRLAGFMALGMTAMAFGCGPGISKEDADLRCNQLRTSIAACMTDAAFQQCVSCHEECGDGCATQETCPVQFTCQK